MNRGRGADTPLHAAVGQDSAEQVLLLLDFGADVNLKDSSNLLPVELAPPGGKAQQLLQAHNGTIPSSLFSVCKGPAIDCSITCSSLNIVLKTTLVITLGNLVNSYKS